MAQGRLWSYVAAAMSAAAVGGVALLFAVHGPEPAAAAGAGVAQWGTVRSVTYHAAGSDERGLIAVVEMFDGRRFVHTVTSASRRIPAPGEVWNIDSDVPPPGWKARK